MLQDADLLVHRLRLSYLASARDGIGERVIDFRHANVKTNSTAFRIAGGDPSFMDRCVSPDIPTDDSLDYIGSSVARADTVSPISTQRSDDPEVGVALKRTITDLSLYSRRSRNNLHDDFNTARLNPALRDDEASDQSDISETEDIVSDHMPDAQQKHMFMMDLHKRISEEPKFEKVPVRRRGTSDAAVTYRSSFLPPPRRPTFDSAKNASETDLSRAAPQSILSEGFMPLRPGAPYDVPPLGSEAIDAYQGPLASFDPVEDSDSDDEYNTIRHDPLANSDEPISLSTSNMTEQMRSYNGLSTVFGTLPKSKPRPESVHQPTSGLTALIKASESAEINPLEKRFGVMSGKGHLKPLKLKMYRPTSATPSKPFEVVIKTTATVFETIGFSLLRYMVEAREPQLTEEQKDPNQWTLRIVEDDGELDEDFPALERTRPISKFSFDEFAIVEATPAQVLENQKLTPGSTAPKSALGTIPEVKLQPASGPPTPHGDQEDMVLVRPGTGAMATTSSTSMATGSATGVHMPQRIAAKPPGAAVLLKIRLRPDPSTPSGIIHAQSTVLDVTTETYLGDVLDQICKKRNLDKYMYLLRLPGSNVVVPPDRTVESLQGRTELNLVRKRPTDLLADSSVSRSMTPNAPIMAANTYSGTRSGIGEANGISRDITDFVASKTYQHWTVWRRQPMSFMGRHERILAIDGEYVHVSPSESKTMFETPKTTSLHIGQIIACKQSRKIPVNFKIVIIKAGQNKRYDFEAVRPQEAEIVVGRIRALSRSFALRTGGGRTSLVAAR